MTVTIIPIEDHSTYAINEKVIMQVTDSTWIVPNPLTSLTEIEKTAFKTYKELIIDNPRFRKHPRSTYKN